MQHLTKFTGPKEAPFTGTVTLLITATNTHKKDSEMEGGKEAGKGREMEGKQKKDAVDNSFQGTVKGLVR